MLLALALAIVQDHSALLGAVPEDAHALLHCADVRALRERAGRNEWVRLGSSERGASFWAELDRVLTEHARTPGASLLGLGRELDGEALLVLSRESSGLLTVPGADREAGIERLIAGLRERGYGPPERELERRGSRLWIFAEEARAEAATDPPRPIAAVVDHPTTLAVFTDTQEQRLLRYADACLSGLEQPRETRLAAGFQAARREIGALGLELYVDFSRLEREAEASLERVAAGRFDEPFRLLGLDAGTWLYATAELSAGSRVELRAHLRLPPDSLMARLADAFVALPPDLLDAVPREAWGLWALGWKIMSFYESARTVLDEARALRGSAALERARAAAEGAAGVDLGTDVVAQLTGPVLVYLCDPEEPAKSVAKPWGSLSPVGVELRVENGSEFEANLCRMLELGFGSEPLPSGRLEGHAIRLFDEDRDSGGLASLGQRVLVSASLDLLARSLRAAGGALAASAGEGTPLAGLFDESLGAFWFSYHELAKLQRAVWPDMPASALDEGVPDGARLVSTARRVPAGIDVRVSTR